MEPFVELPVPFVDDRGKIQNLFLEGMQSGALISSKAGTLRASHHHKTGNHLCYLISGKILYKWRPVGQEHAPNEVLIQPGQAFFSPPMTDHWMHFLEDSVFLAFDSKVARSHDGYETDLVRVPAL
jgi:quercetin dioxygenase-like cupin family protein